MQSESPRNAPEMPVLFFPWRLSSNPDRPMTCHCNRPSISPRIPSRSSNLYPPTAKPPPDPSTRIWSGDISRRKPQSTTLSDAKVTCWPNRSRPRFSSSSEVHWQRKVHGDRVSRRFRRRLSRGHYWSLAISLHHDHSRRRKDSQ
jgi:hypothetical protein